MNIAISCVQPCPLPLHTPRLRGSSLIESGRLLQYTACTSKLQEWNWPRKRKRVVDTTEEAVVTCKNPHGLLKDCSLAQNCSTSLSALSSMSEGDHTCPLRDNMLRLKHAQFSNGISCACTISCANLCSRGDVRWLCNTRQTILRRPRKGNFPTSVLAWRGIKILQKQVV